LLYRGRIVISLLPYAKLGVARREALRQALSAYYANPPKSYYEIAGQSINCYTPELQPFHCDLVSRVLPGQRLIELGCGDAHLCSQIERKGAHYTGVDHSSQLLAENRRRYPSATFLAVDAALANDFDVVASLYTIEHVVDPPAYLQRLWSLARPGGLIAIICPEFIDSDGYAPSIHFGKTPRRLREKIIAGAFGDALAHLIDLYWRAPRWKARARTSQPGAFWINALPSELHGRNHGIDTDAVHLPRLLDLTWWLKERGAEIVVTSQTMPGIPLSVLRYNCYVVAQKNAH
jgi:2-polyprenyl-3-methyl-5-hydroxy-6-metoxy-1,4-benzoquinol methylase